MVKYEFVGAHDKGSENRGQRNKRWGGCEKNRGLQKKCGVRTPPLCTPMRTYSDRRGYMYGHYILHKWHQVVSICV